MYDTFPPLPMQHRVIYYCDSYIKRFHDAPVQIGKDIKMLCFVPL